MLDALFANFEKPEFTFLPNFVELNFSHKEEAPLETKVPASSIQPPIFCPILVTPLAVIAAPIDI